MTAARFDGSTIREDVTAPVRLTGQLGRVWTALSDGEWHTLAELAHAAAPATEAAVSARLRDLRKPRFGGHVVERQLLRRGLYRYRLVVTEKPDPDGRFVNVPLPF